VTASGCVGETRTCLTGNHEKERGAPSREEKRTYSVSFGSSEDIEKRRKAGECIERPGAASKPVAPADSPVPSAKDAETAATE
jgi:hypothetical protein